MRCCSLHGSHPAEEDGKLKENLLWHVHCLAQYFHLHQDVEGAKVCYQPFYPDKRKQKEKTDPMHQCVGLVEAKDADKENLYADTYFE